MAKTQYSFSDDPTKLGRPTGFRITVRDVYPSAGAGFVVALAGDIMTMPGLSEDARRRGDPGPCPTAPSKDCSDASDVVATAGAPKAIGPYSQGIVVGGLVFTAGQIALDPATGEMVAGGIAEQTARALENLRAVLEAAGSEHGAGGEDDGVPHRHGGLRGDERGLRAGVRRAPAGAVHRRGGGAAARSPGRDRGDRTVSGER